MRTLPDRDPDSDVYPAPLLAIERYTNRAEADFRYKTVLGLMQRLHRPSLLGAVAEFKTHAHEKRP
jgi:hypothetical protein